MLGRDHLVNSLFAISTGVLADTGRSTSSGLGSARQLIVVGVRISIHRSRLFQHLAADRTLRSTDRTSCGAGCGNILHSVLSMPSCRSQITQVGALNHFATNGTFDHALAILCAGGLYHLRYTGSMAQCFQDLLFRVVAAAALQSHATSLCAGGLNKGFLVFHQIMAQHGAGDLNHLTEFCAADFADCTCFCIFCAGCLNQAFYLNMVASSRNHSFLCCPALSNSTGVDCFPVFAAGSICYHLSFVPFMGCGDGLVCSITTHSTLVFLYAGGSTGCLLQDTDFEAVLLTFPFNGNGRTGEQREQHHQCHEGRQQSSLHVFTSKQIDYKKKNFWISSVLFPQQGVPPTGYPNLRSSVKRTDCVPAKHFAVYA